MQIYKAGDSEEYHNLDKLLTFQNVKLDFNPKYPLQQVINGKKNLNFVKKTTGMFDLKRI